MVEKCYRVLVVEVSHSADVKWNFQTRVRGVIFNVVMYCDSNIFSLFHLNTQCFTKITHFPQIGNFEPFCCYQCFMNAMKMIWAGLKMPVQRTAFPIQSTSWNSVIINKSQQYCAISSNRNKCQMLCFSPYCNNYCYVIIFAEIFPLLRIICWTSWSTAINDYWE